MDQGVIELDASQRAVIDACGPGAVLSVVGAPGTGKTQVLRECVKAMLERQPDARIAVLHPDRRAAGELRNLLSVDIGGWGESVAVQSITACAFSIVSAYEQMQGRRAPELISGPDQDSFLRDLFELAEQGVFPSINEESLASMGVALKTTSIQAFRSEMRDLITRAPELEINADKLNDLGTEHGRAAWNVGASVMRIYENALATQSAMSHDNPTKVDHARIIAHAAAALRQWEENSRGKPWPKPRWDYVFVDDVHNATLALRALLLAMRQDGTAVITFGNPDQGVQSYRGGIAQLPSVLTYSPLAGGIGAQLYVLDTCYRGVEQLLKLQELLWSGIHAGGTIAQRSVRHVREHVESVAFESSSFESSSSFDSPVRPVPHSSDVVSAYSFPNDTEEIAWIAERARSLHVDNAVAYSEMAIITRSHAQHRSIRAALVKHGLPVGVQPSVLPLRDQPAVSTILKLIHFAIDDCCSDSEPDISQILGGCIAGIDPLELRKIGRRLTAQARVSGRIWNERDVWNAFSSDPGIDIFKTEPALEPFIRAIENTRAAVAKEFTAGQVLWELWSSFDVAHTWQEQALGEGAEADQAHEQLDSVIQLFRVAQRLFDQDPQKCSIQVLVAQLEAQDLPEDSIAPSSASGDAIVLATPAALAGKHWKHVFIMGVNEGVWPDTRLRNPLSRAPELVSIVVGAILAGAHVNPSQLREEVIDDELRMLLHAVSRAEESVMFTCVHTDENLPSRFIEWIAQDQAGQYRLQHVPHTVSVMGMHGLIGELRRAQTCAPAAIAAAASQELHRLAEAGYEEAREELWVNTMRYTGTGTSRENVSISPSRISSMLACPLRGFLSSIGGENADERTAADMGTLIHAIAENHPHGGYEEMLSELNEKWYTLNLLPDRLSTAIQYQRAVKMLETLDAYIAQAPEGVLVEQKAVHHADSYTVRARLDRLEFSPEHPHSLRVVDLKTGKNPPTAAEVAVHPQLLLYQWLVNHQKIEGMPDLHAGRWDSAGACLVYLGEVWKKKLPIRDQAEAGEREDTYAQRMMDATADLIREENFLARPSYRMCKQCLFSSLCPAHEGEKVFE